MCSIVNGIFSQIFSNAMVIVINNQGIVKKTSRERSKSPAITTIFAIYRREIFQMFVWQESFLPKSLKYFTWDTMINPSAPYKGWGIV